MGARQFKIQFGGLAPGSHLFEAEIDNSFFEHLEFSEIRQAQVHVEMELIKQNNVMSVIFRLTGKVGTECDRCLKDFFVPVDARHEMVLKHGNPEESTDEIIVLPPGAHELDVAQLIYEFLVLSLPLRKVPCELFDNFECDKEVLVKLGDVETENPEPGPEQESIWEKLKGINFNNN